MPVKKTKTATKLKDKKLKPAVSPKTAKLSSAKQQIHETVFSDKKLSRNPGELFNLVKYLESEKVEEFEYTEGDFSITLKHNKPGSGGSALNLADNRDFMETLLKLQHQAPEKIDSPALSTFDVKQEAARKEAEDESKYKFIESPITGTFYAASSPTAQPYVSLNQKVSKGQVVCIVEAMKLMNEIKSEHTGIIHKICFENAKPVQAKQRLFYVIPE
ncbi:MAG TPA: acetyl-CoA carboxylase biotin carboxyl carrier protein [Candidatus Wallbacteria bacterium]|nr:acetyl-CoA carboxylase biotin carboxyl carrier protein [Candidatus Wallbacteria bacterium]